MLLGYAQVLPDRAAVVGGVLEESVEAGAEADGVGDEGGAVISASFIWYSEVLQHGIVTCIEGHESGFMKV